MTVDTDIVLLSIAFVSEMDVDSLWIDFAVGTSLGYISEGDLAAN